MEESHRFRPRDPTRFVEPGLRFDAATDRFGKEVGDRLVHVHPVRRPVKGVSDLGQGTEKLDAKARLLVRLPDRGLFIGLALLERAFRQAPDRLSRLPEQEDTAGRIHDHGTGRATWPHRFPGPDGTAADSGVPSGDRTDGFAEVCAKGGLQTAIVKDRGRMICGPHRDLLKGEVLAPGS